MILHVLILLACAAGHGEALMQPLHLGVPEMNNASAGVKNTKGLQYLAHPPRCAAVWHGTRARKLLPPTILRGGSDDTTVSEAAIQLPATSAVTKKEEEDDDVEDAPSTFMFAGVTSLLILCISAMSIVAKKGTTVSAFLSHQQELFLLSFASLTAGYQVCLWLALYARSKMESAQADTTAAIFMQSVVKYGSLSVAVTCLLGSLGVNINGLTAALGSMGLAIGLASQRVLENIAAGIMLMIFRNFQVGDIVQVAGKMGVVCKITLLATRIDTFSNVRMSIPNKDIFGHPVENFSRNVMRRAEVEIGTAGSSDIEAVRRTLETVCANYDELASSFLNSDKRRRRSRALAAQKGALAIAQARAALESPPPPPLPAGKGRVGATLKNILDSPRKLVDNVKKSETGARLSLMDFLTVSKPAESLEEQMRTGITVSTPVVVLKEIKTWGYLWEVRVFVPGARFDSLRCKLVEDIGMALKKNHIRIVADIVEERKKVVGL